LKIFSKPSQKIQTILVVFGLAAVTLACLIFWPKATRPGEVSEEVYSVDETEYDQLRTKAASATEQEFPTVVRRLLSTENGDLRAEWLPKILLQWMESDARGLLAFLHDLEVQDPGGKWMTSLAPWLLEVLPDLSDRMAGSLTVLAILDRLIANTARQDPTLALSWAQDWLVGRGLDAALASIVPHLVQIDSLQARRLILEMKTVPNRLSAVLSVATYLGSKSPEEGLRWAETLPWSADRAYGLSGVLAAMAENNPNQASALFSQKTEQIQQAFTAQVFADREQTGWDLEGEFEGMTEEQAREALSNLPDPNVFYFRRAAYAIGSSWASENPEEAMRWASNIPTAHGGEDARAAVLETWAEQSPTAAWEAFRQLPSPSPQVASRLFQSWAVRQPAAAASALVNLATGPLREAAVQGLVHGSLEGGKSARQIATIAENLPTAADRDTAKHTLAEAESFEDPMFAWGLVRSISDPRRQQAAFLELFPSLAEVNPREARRALRMVSLPQVQIEYFESLLRVTE
jgi:hypothetical protein